MMVSWVNYSVIYLIIVGHFIHLINKYLLVPAMCNIMHRVIYKINMDFALMNFSPLHYSTNMMTIFLHIWIAFKQVPKGMMYFVTLLEVQGSQCLQILFIGNSMNISKAPKGTPEDNWGTGVKKSGSCSFWNNLQENRVNESWFYVYTWTRTGTDFQR